MTEKCNLDSSSQPEMFYRNCLQVLEKTVKKILVMMTFLSPAILLKKLVGALHIFWDFWKIFQITYSRGHL